MHHRVELIWVEPVGQPAHRLWFGRLAREEFGWGGIRHDNTILESGCHNERRAKPCAEVDAAPWTSELSETVDDRRIFIVATDAERFTTSWGVDGVRFTGLEATVGYVPLMDESDAARECTLAVEEDFENLQYIGELRRYEGCGEGTEAVVIGANDIDGEGTVVVELQMVEFDPAVLGLIVISFVV